MIDSDLFSASTTSWFNKVFAEPTPAQSQGWKAIGSGGHTLIHAPTGSGKTLAAFLWAVDRMITEPSPPTEQRCRILYISPMKALAYDVDRNLRAPLTGIAAEANLRELEVHDVSVAMRTGDTPQSERQAMRRHPPDILITTPESLYLMLTSQVREILAFVDTVIVDEVHAIAGTKRGAHLAVSLERLDELCNTPPQRIGLSATQRPLTAISEFLGGGTSDGDTWRPRPVEIIDAPRDRVLDIEIVVPVPDMERPTVGETDDAPAASPSIWPAMYPRLLDLLQSHRSTIFFVNSRGLAERLAAELNRLADEEVAQAHHGSVSREQRLLIEDKLKKGELRAVVATSTLELGIDMAAVDLVVLVESPSSVASGLQRVGRAGHQVGAASKARIFPKHRGDLLEATVVVNRMLSGSIESTTIPQNPLDVLAQHIVAMVAIDDRTVADTYELIRRSATFRNLSREAFEGVLDMLAGRYPSDDFADLKPRIVWDRGTGALTPRSNARLLAVTNPGTIPDRGLYTVNLPEGSRVGELDEEMVYESRPGDTFILGSTTWRIENISHDRVTVTPAPGAAAARMPFWHGEAKGRPLELGRAVGVFTREVAALDEADGVSLLEKEYRLDPWAAQNLVQFIRDEHDATGALPTDKTIVVQRFRDEIGDWRVVLLSPFGGRVHAPWALAARNRFRHLNAGSVDVIWSDDGIMFRFPDTDTAPDVASIYMDPTEVEQTLVAEVGDSALFTSIFREAAARALLLPRRRPGSRTPLWLQRRKAANLLEVTRRFGSFPIMLETYREVLQDHFDVPALAEVLTDISKRTVRVVEVDIDKPSPFARSLMFDFIASFMYEYDAPLAERRAAALALDRDLLADLLGEPEFRDLLDADVIATVEADLQHLSEDRQVRSMDAVHDVLRDLGPLDLAGIKARTREPDLVEGWLGELTASRRVLEMIVIGGTKYAAIEDVARLRDSIGVQPPPGIPTEFLDPVPDPLGDIVGRYARTHGPFTARDAAAATGVAPAVVSEILGRLSGEDKVTSGAFRPGGEGQEWIAATVLNRLRRRSLAVLRKDVEAVEPVQFARFLPAWQGVETSSNGNLTDVLSQLQGAVLPASDLESRILAVRVDGAAGALDRALAQGEIVWVGVEPLGSRDGKLALYRRDAFASVAPITTQPPPDGPHHTQIITRLTASGASFFADIYGSIGGDPLELSDALWDLVWAGVVTNDSLSALRAFTSRRTSSKRRRNTVASFPPQVAGRWSLVETLRSSSPSNEERGVAIATMVLERYGVVVRDAVAAEGISGGFSGIYPVLSSLEDIGSVRRGYFIEGLGGAQFALPGAIERLRAQPATPMIVLAATDPANPYGAILPWPPSEGTPQRRAGSTLTTMDGLPVVWLDAGGKRAVTFEADTELTVEALWELVSRRSRSAVSSIDSAQAHDHPLAPLLEKRGFVPGYKGFTIPRHATNRP
ncbi:MAG: ATP-dependent helicase [Acidimicrobiia bacterium]|nr:MAG: ATP-dependent helicase [Acidimicrobiia bacterium]